MTSQKISDRRLVGVEEERVTHVSSTDFPGHYPGEDHSWNLDNFKKVRELRKLCSPLVKHRKGRA